ncbi:hypothetical protein ACF0H5_019566 [Mactra antiquata]
MGNTVCSEARTDGRVLFLGIPDSGKTTALYYLKMKQTVITIPTYGYNSEKILTGKHIRDIWDIGGRVDDRDDYLYCMKNVAAIVYFIDCAAGHKRFSLAINKLELMLAESELENCAVAIAANKQDLDTNISIVDIKTLLSEKDWMKYRYWKVFPVTATAGTGFDIMLKWIDKHCWKVKKRPKEKPIKPKRKRRRWRRTVRHGSFIRHGKRKNRDTDSNVAMKFNHVVSVT